MNLVKEKYKSKEVWKPDRIHWKVALAITVVSQIVAGVQFLLSGTSHYSNVYFMVLEVLFYSFIFTGVYYLSRKTERSIENGLKFAAAYGTLLAAFTILFGIGYSIYGSSLVGLVGLSDIPGGFIMGMVVYGAFNFYSSENLRKAAIVSVLGGILALGLDTAKMFIFGSEVPELLQVLDSSGFVVFSAALFSLFIVLTSFSRFSDISTLESEEFASVILIGLGSVTWILNVAAYGVLYFLGSEAWKYMFEMMVWDVHNLAIICSGLVILVFYYVDNPEDFWELFY